MELHAWVVTVPCFKTAQAKRMGKKGLLHTHPSWLKRHADSYYLDPGLPGVAEYIAGICQEITENYDIDGIHFDYIRYPENAESFSDAIRPRDGQHSPPCIRMHRDGCARALWICSVP